MKHIPPLQNTELISTNEGGGLAPLRLNPDEYRDDLKEFDLTEEQQNELLQTLWNIMSTFVDLGWGVDSVQMFLPDLFGKVAPDSEKLLESGETQKFNQTASAGKGNNDD